MTRKKDEEDEGDTYATSRPNFPEVHTIPSADCLNWVSFPSGPKYLYGRKQGSYNGYCRAFWDSAPTRGSAFRGSIRVLPPGLKSSTPNPKTKSTP